MGILVVDPEEPGALPHAQPVSLDGAVARDDVLRAQVELHLGLGQLRHQGLEVRPEGAQLLVDPLAPGLDDPSATYRRLRDEAPVPFCAERGIYSITRYDDAMYVLRTPELFSSRAISTSSLRRASGIVAVVTT